MFKLCHVINYKTYCFVNIDLLNGPINYIRGSMILGCMICDQLLPLKIRSSIVAQGLVLDILDTWPGDISIRTIFFFKFEC